MKSYSALKLTPIIGSKLWVNWLAAFIPVENEPFKFPWLNLSWNPNKASLSPVSGHSFISPTKFNFLLAWRKNALLCTSSRDWWFLSFWEGCSEERSSVNQSNTGNHTRISNLLVVPFVSISYNKSGLESCTQSFVQIMHRPKTLHSWREFVRIRCSFDYEWESSLQFLVSSTAICELVVSLLGKSPSSLSLTSL